MSTKAKASSKKSRKSAPKATVATTADHLYRTSKVHKSAKSVRVDQLPTDYQRADLEFIGVDHSGASYEARVYVNNPNANANTQTTPANGYAGSFYIFGHGGCFGDVGHCDIHPKRDEFDPRPSSPLEPIKKVVVATDAIKTAAAQTSEINVTVVPVILSWTEKSELTDVCKYDHINLVTYY
ncbi:MAG TPA: hypothetical protein VK557_02265 [Pyrinomonadaceae bacterium]|nr:hypothetical protein [Pyrinomonadaceae bacterium]